MAPMTVPRPVHAANLPKPVGPYSPGVAFGDLIFVSGQGAIDPATGRLSGPDVESQTRQCLENVRTILEAAGSDLSCVLRCGVFLLDMREFDRMNAVYASHFAADGRPARTTVGVTHLARGGIVEIDMIAARP